MTIFAQLKSTESSQLATAAQLKTMADKRLEEAKLLYGKKFYDTAYYLSGHAVDFALKAVICKRLNIEAFDVSMLPQRNTSLPGLLVLAGLQSELSDKKNADPEFDAAWSLVSQWNESSRLEDSCSQKTAREFLIGTNTLLSWIKNYW
ncbi:MAG: HEPN domain-containing protein [Spirosomataceae bacterium]